MTELVPQIDAKADLTSILRSLTDQKTKAPESPSAAPNLVEVREGALEALNSLSVQLGAVEVPSERRLLTPAEREELGRLVSTAKKAKTAVDSTVETVKGVVFDHFDVTLEDEQGAKPGEADYSTDKHGHYLVGQEVFVPGLGERLTRELSETAPQVVARDLYTLWRAGEISREDYYEATEHVEVPRQVVDEKLAALLKRKPELLGKIAGAITPGNVTSSFHVRPPTKGRTNRK